MDKQLTVQLGHGLVVSSCGHSAFPGMSCVAEVWDVWLVSDIHFAVGHVLIAAFAGPLSVAPPAGVEKFAHVQSSPPFGRLGRIEFGSLVCFSAGTRSRTSKDDCSANSLIYPEPQKATEPAGLGTSWQFRSIATGLQSSSSRQVS